MTDPTTGAIRIWSRSGWEAPTEDPPDCADIFGINTTADTTNRLSLAAPASLFSHDGANHRLKINRNATADAASVLFQTGWSGRADLGLAGSDDWALKVSPDGSSWNEALKINTATGLANGEAVKQSPTDITRGTSPAPIMLVRRAIFSATLGSRAERPPVR